MLPGPHEVIVSPFLEAAPEGLVPALLAAAQDQNEMRRAPGHEQPTLLLDQSTWTLLVMSAADTALLARLRQDRAAIAALAASDTQQYERFLACEALVPAAVAFRRHAYHTVEIEVNRHCNLRCVFCPVEAAPKPRGFMSRDLFELVLARVVEYGASEISLNHYSEPTLTPDLVDRIARAAALGLRVRLHTNASLLDEDKIRGLAGLGNVRLFVNLPTLDRAEYERVTGSKFFDRVVRNLELLGQHRVPTSLSINAPRDSASETVRAINERFAALFGASIAWPTDTRAGRVDKTEYATTPRHDGPLGGCGYATRQINVTHEGKVFLCCQDYEQEYVLGDLREQSLREIAEGERAVALRRWIFGYETPPPGFLCSTCAWTRPATPAFVVGSGKFSDILTSDFTRALAGNRVRWVGRQSAS
jgi:radical SAM protein with 4Fe4S-binding SPASM domain